MSDMSFFLAVFNSFRNAVTVLLTFSRQLCLHNVPLNNLTALFLKKILFSKGAFDHFFIISILPRTYCSPFARLYTGLPLTHYLICVAIYSIGSFRYYHRPMLRTFYLLHFKTITAVPAYFTIILIIIPAKQVEQKLPGDHFHMLSYKS